VTFVAADVANYGLALTEIAGTGEYQLDIADLHATLRAAGGYRYQYFLRSGANQAITDVMVGEEDVLWDGAALVDPEVAPVRTALALPAVAPAANGGLGTVDAANRVAGVSGNVAGSVGSVAGNVTGSVGSLATQAKADVAAQTVAGVSGNVKATNADGAALPTAEENRDAYYQSGHVHFVVKEE
jgi:hypothetical protein